MDPLQAGRATAPSPQKVQAPGTALSTLGRDLPGEASSTALLQGEMPEGRQGQAKPAPPGSPHLSREEPPGPSLSPRGAGPKADGTEALPQESAEAGQPDAGPVAAEPSPPSQQLCAASVGDTPEVQTAAETPGAGDEQGTRESPSTPTSRNCPGRGPTALELQEESFRDPAEVLGMGAEIDYLEQFGTCSFKESALRKQSLYLKFDPLLRDSPVRLMPLATAAEAGSTQVAAEPSEGPLDTLLVDLDLGGALPVPVSASVPLEPQVPAPPPCVLEPSCLPLPVGPIVDVLQYSQRDLDAAVRAAQEENLELRSRCEELHTKNLEMGKIMDGFEGIVYQAMEEVQKQKEAAKAEVQKVLKERDQLAADLSSTEKSFSDLFKRFEKQKEVISGYRKVGLPAPRPAPGAAAQPGVDSGAGPSMGLGEGPLSVVHGEPGPGRAWAQRGKLAWACCAVVRGQPRVPGAWGRRRGGSASCQTARLTAGRGLAGCLGVRVNRPQK